MLSALLSQPTLATDLRNEPIPPGVCDEVISACDQAIEKRNQLIQLQADRINQIKDQNEELQAAIVKLSRENEGRLQENLLYGGGGLLIGIIAGILLAK